MNKRYLQPGEIIDIHFVGYVGPSGTLADLKADLAKTIDFCGNDHNAMPGCQNVGTVVIDGYTADVFIEEDTGKLWYNDDGWY